MIEAHDRTLWAMGMEELERNCVVYPMQVQSDFHLENGERISQEQLDSEVDASEVRNINVLLPPANDACNGKTSGALLKGSYHRVVVVYPKEQRLWKRTESGGGNSAAGTAAVSQGVYEVILYKGEAYYKELDLTSQFDGWLDSLSVVDYCRGWQHSLIAAGVTAKPKE